MLNQEVTEYRKDIEGLRGIAILLVVGFHYFGVKGGFVGVDIFFVISGYLITAIILKDIARHNFSFAVFFARRVRRIFPALVLMLAGVWLFSWSQLFANDFQQVTKHIMAGSLYVQNFLLWHESGYFDAESVTKPLLHLWSLAIEEQFYLLWPVLLYVFRNYIYGSILSIVLVIFSTFILNIVFIYHNATTAFYMPFCRLWELALGGILSYVEIHSTAILLRIKQSNFIKNILSWLGILLIVLSASLLTKNVLFPGWLALLPALGAMLVIGAGSYSTINRTLLSTKTLGFLGKISYPLYLWHWPALSFAVMLFSSDGKISKIVKLSAFFLSVALSIITYLWIEKPIQKRYKVNIENAHKILIVGLASTTFIFFLALLSYKQVILPRFSDVTPIAEVPMQLKGCMVEGNDEHANLEGFSQCERVLFPNRPTVFVLGDSHANSLYQGLEGYFHAKRINVVNYTVMHCIPLSLLDSRKACTEYNDYIKQKMSAQKPDLVIYAAHHTNEKMQNFYHEQLDYSHFIHHELEQLQKQGVKHTILIGQIPIWEVSLPHVINMKFLRYSQPVPQRTYIGVVKQSLQQDDIFRQMSYSDAMSYFSLKDTLCTQDGCLVSVGEHLPSDLIVWDYGHLTLAGSDFVINHGLAATIERFIHTGD